MDEKMMIPTKKILLTGFILIAVLFLQPGCVKKEEVSEVSVTAEAAAPVELPVLDQNRVAPNPMAPGQQEIVFEPVKEEVPPVPAESEEDLQEPSRPIGD